jgi:alpha-beta hydrolase superfamily lysophospholipase
MREMAEAGYIVCGCDQVGHGKTAREESELGYIAGKDGWRLLVSDVAVFSEAVRAEYGRDLPYFLMGHSMGSFIVRLAAETCVRPDGLIVMGTAGPNPIAGMGLALIGLIKIFKGDHHISPFIDNMAFGSYNDRFKADGHPKAWLTKDAAVRDAYMADPFCTFKFTVSAMGDLIRLIKESNRKAWFKALPDGLPILLVSGTDDPVGDYGQGVTTVRDRLAAAGKDVTCILYDGYRHEILNDDCHDRVVSDIRTFLTASKGAES